MQAGSKEGRKEGGKARKQANEAVSAMRSYFHVCDLMISFV